MTAVTTLTDTLTSRKSHLRDITLALFGSFLIALMAHVAIPLPFTPVPFTGQTFAVLILGALLGSRLGALTVSLYVAEGVAGLPVFAGGAGPAYLFGPTGGYLMGCIAAAFITGYLAEKGWIRNVFLAAIAMLAGNAAIYLFGLSWLSHFTGANYALAAGFYPFIITDLLKIALAATSLPTARRVLKLRHLN